MPPDQPTLTFPPSCKAETIALYDYWCSKRGNRPMPSRADVDPLEIPARLLPCLCLVDVVDDARRYVYRLVGTAEVQARDYDPTGKSVAEAFYGPDATNALFWYDKVVATKAPLLDTETFVATNGRYATEETLFLPLSDDGVTVNKIMVFSPFRDVLDPNATEQLDL